MAKRSELQLPPIHHEKPVLFYHYFWLNSKVIQEPMVESKGIRTADTVHQNRSTTVNENEMAYLMFFSQGYFMLGGQSYGLFDILL